MVDYTKLYWIVKTFLCSLVTFTLLLFMLESISDVLRRAVRTFLPGVILVFCVWAIVSAFSFLFSKVISQSPGENQGRSLLNTTQPVTGNTDSLAVTAGRLLSHGNCNGTGPVTLSVSPMRPEDFSILIPYGLVVGGHVTPIDHQYFSPTEFFSKRDKYPVYALANARLVEIGSRPRTNPNNPNDKFEEYRIVFSHSCTFFTYFDLVTSLTPEINAVYQAKKDRSGYAVLDIPITAGQLIGRIGGQTLDFAVWNTEKPLTGFITPKLYEGESWKIFTVNPNDYVTPELKALFIQKNPRTALPIEGKIDYDQPGKLVGNWFREGTDGYASRQQSALPYWDGHLAIVPDHYDPNVYRISFGNFGGEAKQFVSKDISFDASTVDISRGIVKISLVDGIYVTSTGAFWDNFSLTKGPKLRASNSSNLSCVLFQVMPDEKLKMEQFIEKTCASTSGFTAKAQMYYR